MSGPASDSTGSTGSTGNTGDQGTVDEVVARVLGTTWPSRPVIVCVDGRSGSGKTTLARRLARRLRDLPGPA